MRWTGSQAMSVIHLVWALIFARAIPLKGSQRMRRPFLSAEAKRRPSGDQAVQRTWVLCSRHVWGGEVRTSQKRTEVSPPPDARCFPSGLYETCNTASVCPGIVSEHLVTGRTRKIASG